MLLCRGCRTPVEAVGLEGLLQVRTDPHGLSTVTIPTKMITMVKFFR